MDKLLIRRGRASIINRDIVKMVLDTECLKVDRNTFSSCAANLPVASATKDAGVVEIDNTRRLSECEATVTGVAASICSGCLFLPTTGA